MCGYCTTTAFLHLYQHDYAALMSEINDGGFYPIACNFLVESTTSDLDNIGSSLFEQPNLQYYAMLRCADYQIAGDDSFPTQLKRIIPAGGIELPLNHSEIETHLDSLNITPPASLTSLYMQDTYLDANLWVNRIGASIDWLPSSKSLLSHYYDWWLSDQAHSEVKKALAASDTPDKGDGVSDKDRALLLSMLPPLSHAINVVGTHEPDSDTLQNIAFSYPKGTPDFNAEDLWLMRKAMRFCLPYASNHTLEVFSAPETAALIDYVAARWHQDTPVAKRIESISKSRL